MIETRSITAEIGVAPSLRFSILSSLERDGWIPAILASEKKFMELAGVLEKLDASVLRETEAVALYRRLPINLGEIFFKDADVFYIISYDKRTRRTIRDEKPLDGIEVGVISSNPDGLDKRLGEFKKSVENAIKESGDGRKTRDYSFDWEKRRTESSQLHTIIGEDSETGFVRAEINSEQVEAARVLENEIARKLLIEVSQAGFAREQDISKRWSKNKSDFEDALTNLKNQGLVETEYLLECKKTGNPLTRLKQADQIENEGVGKLVCPSCGSSFSRERLSEGYTISEKGRSISSKSHWMTIWVTNLLCELGVSKESILWNLSENGEEVDILMEFLGHLWIFELKDREFGAGDAHPFNYRQVRFRATKAVVVTTDKVSRDAKRVFQELQREANTRRRNVEPIFIEGLNMASDVLNRELSRTALGYASALIELIGLNSGLNLKAILASRFGESIESIQQTEDFVPF